MLSSFAKNPQGTITFFRRKALRTENLKRRQGDTSPYSRFCRHNFSRFIAYILFVVLRQADIAAIKKEKNGTKKGEKEFSEKMFFSFSKKRVQTPAATRTYQRDQQLSARRQQRCTFSDRTAQERNPDRPALCRTRGRLRRSIRKPAGCCKHTKSFYVRTFPRVCRTTPGKAATRGGKR